MPEWLNLADPVAQKIVAGAAAFIVLVIVVRIWSGYRNKVIAARRRAELRRSYDSVRLQQEEIKRLADRIQTTSSTARITGFTIVRQVEAVFTEGRTSSVAALELCKALAAQKGGNAVINLQARQTPSGKWVASGDAVVVQDSSERGQH
ncbi:MAG: hypothetical protein KAY37_15455 [Phycisphaerae bacterium]|nr:hypothetical protein [Phycisphaerae bacterium]